MRDESADLSNLPDQLRHRWSSASLQDVKPQSAAYPGPGVSQLERGAAQAGRGSEQTGQLGTGPLAHREFSPRYAFGRHRGPAPRFAHSAAVLITLLPARHGEWDIPLTLRPSQMSDHGGQVSLPGGRAEGGESVWRTACREFGEELGCTTETMQPIGELTPLYVYASRHRVTPMVAVCSLRPSMKPNPDEVAELILLPVRQLISDTIKTVGTMRRGNVEFEAPGLQIADHFVWGATAMILGEFRSIAKSIVDTSHSEPWLM